MLTLAVTSPSLLTDEPLPAGPKLFPFAELGLSVEAPSPIPVGTAGAAFVATVTCDPLAVSTAVAAGGLGVTGPRGVERLQARLAINKKETAVNIASVRNFLIIHILLRNEPIEMTLWRFYDKDSPIANKKVK